MEFGSLYQNHCSSKVSCKNISYNPTFEIYFSFFYSLTYIFYDKYTHRFLKIHNLFIFSLKKWLAHVSLANQIYLKFTRIISFVKTHFKKFKYCKTK